QLAICKETTAEPRAEALDIDERHQPRHVAKTVPRFAVRAQREVHHELAVKRDVAAQRIKLATEPRALLDFEGLGVHRENVEELGPLALKNDDHGRLLGGEKMNARLGLLWCHEVAVRNALLDVGDGGVPAASAAAASAASSAVAASPACTPPGNAAAAQEITRYSYPLNASNHLAAASLRRPCPGGKRSLCALA